MNYDERPRRELEHCVSQLSRSPLEILEALKTGMRDDLKDLNQPNIKPGMWRALRAHEISHDIELITESIAYILGLENKDEVSL